MMNQTKSRYVVDLPKHLAICEYNYHRLLKLMPGLQQQRNEPGSAQQLEKDKGPLKQWQYLISGFNGELKDSSSALTISVTEIAKYTTMLHICVSAKALSCSRVTQDKAMKINAAENSLLVALSTYSFDVRLYHDALLAEVVSSKGCRQFKARHEYPNQEMHQSDEKSQLNQFLGELVTFCLAKGRVTERVIGSQV